MLVAAEKDKLYHHCCKFNTYMSHIKHIKAGRCSPSNHRYHIKKMEIRANCHQKKKNSKEQLFM